MEHKELKYTQLDKLGTAHKAVFHWNVKNLPKLGKISRSQQFCPVPGSSLMLHLAMTFLDDRQCANDVGLEFWRGRNVMEIKLLSCSEGAGTPSPASSLNLRLAGHISLGKFEDILQDQMVKFGRDTHYYIPKAGICLACFKKASEGTLPIPKKYSSFTITLTIYIWDFFVSSHQMKIQSHHQVVDDMRRMYESRIHTDLTIRFGERSLRAHKAVLCSRSPVFERMLHYDMLEKINSCIEIEDFSLETFDIFLKTLYTGEVDKNVDFPTLVDVLKAVDKYDLPETTRIMCVQAMLSDLTVDTACVILKYANMANYHEHKQFVMHFIQSRFSETACTQSWAEMVLDEPQLAEEVAKGLSSKK